MNLKILFKRLILLDFLIILIIFPAAFFESKEVLNFNENIPISDSFLILAGVWLLAAFVSFYLLYNFKELGKPMYLVVFISGLVLSLIGGPIALDAWMYVLDSIECAISGALIFILYFTSIKKEFDK
tara:strand:- start:154 stop:534 length:381 start_codon:yes stop_codon:yes gene_type:complete